jgi:hypothetical protein
VGDEETQMRTKQLLHMEESAPEEDAGMSSCHLAILMMYYYLFIHSLCS